MIFHRWGLSVDERDETHMTSDNDSNNGLSRNVGARDLKC